MTGRNLWFDALVGATVAVVLAFLPLSPVLGGAVAGYLHRESGARVGAISGVFAAIPVALVASLGAAFFVPVAPGAVNGVLLLVLLLAAIVGLYEVVLGALGGVLGVYLFREFGPGRVQRNVPSD